ncbi:MAG: LysE family translocator [Rudaea sp.]
MVQLVLIGLGMGLAFAAPPGVVTAETLRRGLRGGFGHALSVQAGSLIGDASYAIIAFLGLAALLQAPLARTVVGVFGALFLLYLGWQSLKMPAPLEGVSATQRESYRDAFLSGMLLSLTNPWAIAFWVSLGSSFAALGLSIKAGVPLLLASFMLGALLWSFVLSGLIDRGRHLLSPRLFRGTSILCGLALIALAAGGAAHVISNLFL